MTKLQEALRTKYGTPKACMAALGLDEALLEDKPNTAASGEGTTMQTSAIALDQRLRRPEVIAALKDAELKLRRQRGQHAMDSADNLQEMLEELMGDPGGGPESSMAEKHEEIKSNLGIPNTMKKRDEEEPGEDDMNDLDERHAALKEFLEPKLAPEDMRHVHDMLGGGEEEEEDPHDMSWAHDRRRRADDARKRLGRDETEEEMREREEREERGHAKDRMNRRAEDARKRLGRDESEEERREREECERGHDQALDAMRRARDMRRQARDAMRRAHDRRRAMDFRHRMGRDWSKEEEEEDRRKRAEDRLVSRRGGMMKPVEDKRRRGAMDQQTRTVAMDAAAIDRLVERRIAEARDNDRALYVARDKVRSLVGELAMDGITSPAEIYRQVLEMRGIATRGIHPSAYEALLDMELSRPREPNIRLASDSTGNASSFAEMFPAAAAVRRL